MSCEDGHHRLLNVNGYKFTLGHFDIRLISFHPSIHTVVMSAESPPDRIQKDEEESSGATAGAVFKGPVYKGPVFRGEVFKGEVFKGNLFKGNVFKGVVHKVKLTNGTGNDSIWA